MSTQELQSGRKNVRCALLPLLASLLGAAACDSPAASPDEGASHAFVDASDVAAAFRARGAVVEEKGVSVTSIFSVPGHELVVNGAGIVVFRFAGESHASAEVPHLTQSLIHWAAPVRLYRTGALLVLHVGRDPAVHALLESVLGAPVARIG
jgi:hypothetical protein